jgi:hypothetical protein
MNTTVGQAAALPRLAGFRHIIDDGDCPDHGFYLPKQQAGTFRSVCNCGVELVDVSSKDLQSVLNGVSANQQALLASVK